MPLYDAPLVSKSPVVGFGAGDLHIASGISPEDGNARRYLLIHALPEGGAIGTPEETGRTFALAGVSTDKAPADVAFYFANEASLDQVLAILSAIKEDFQGGGGAH